MPAGPSQESGPWPEGHVGHLVAARAATLGQRPLVTFSDGASGERTELGYGTFENWVAKTANLLVEELELQPGDVLATDLGTHWTTLVILAAAWRVGAVIGLPGAAGQPAGAAIREGQEVPDVPHLVVGTGLGARMTGDPGEGIPFAEEVLAYPDDFPDHPGTGADGVLLVAGPDGVEQRSSAQLLAAAARLGERAGLVRGARYASTVPLDTEAGIVAGPVLALAGGSGLVLITGTPAGRVGPLITAERCAVVLAPPGAPVGEIEAPVVEVDPAGGSGV